MRPRRSSKSEVGEAGLTLVQLLVSLAVLLVLALVLPACLAVYVNHTRNVRAERDAHAIAEAIQHFEQDTGFLPAWLRSRDGGPGLEADAVDLLVGPGEVPKLASREGWRSARSDTLRNQLIDDGPGYGRGRPTVAAAWRGPYLPASLGPDPWQNRYMVNVGVRAGASASEASSQPAIFVLSAGPNGIVETAHQQVSDRVAAGGDDVVVRVR